MMKRGQIKVVAAFATVLFTYQAWDWLRDNPLPPTPHRDTYGFVFAGSLPYESEFYRNLVDRTRWTITNTPADRFVTPQPWLLMTQPIEHDRCVLMRTSELVDCDAILRLP